MSPHSTAPNPLPAVDAFGHGFADPTLLHRALAHRSAGQPHNERLEFLGDSLVGAIIAEWLYERLPQASEGSLTRLRAQLVRRESLADRARALSLGDHLRLGQGELRSGGFRRDSILADAFEALVAAIYLDAGWQACRSWVRGRFADVVLDDLPGRAVDAKTRLQEWLQAAGRALPSYTIIDTSGEAHTLRFTVQCQVDGEDRLAQGEAGSRKQAEQLAAQAMLAYLEPTPE